MKNSLFYGFLVGGLVLGLVFGLFFGGITGKATWWETLLEIRSEPATPSSTTPTSPTTSPSMTSTIPSGVTYQGILNMLNKCTISYSRNNSTNTCNNVCQSQGKTCVQAYSFDEVAEVTFPYECLWMAGTNTNALICNCCSLPGEAQTTGTAGSTVCHYWPEDYPEDCVAGSGRWRCDGQCGAGAVN